MKILNLKILLKILKAKPFEISYNFSNHGSKFLYYRAFAKNDKFESFEQKRIKIDLPVQPKIAGAQILEANQNHPTVRKLPRSTKWMDFS